MATERVPTVRRSRCAAHLVFVLRLSPSTIVTSKAVGGSQPPQGLGKYVRGILNDSCSHARDQRQGGQHLHAPGVTGAARPLIAGSSQTMR
jgi:hypothetical protein